MPENEPRTCRICGREVLSSEHGYVHKDGRVKHAPVIEEETMSRTEPIYDPYEPTLSLGNPADVSLLTTNSDLTKDAEKAFGDMDIEWGDITEPEGFMDDKNTEEIAEIEGEGSAQNAQNDANQDLVTEPLVSVTDSSFGRPRREDMVTVRGGGLYLTARRRIVWLRGEPVQHPDWTIDTYAEEIERGKYVSNNKIEGGYARYRANLFDTDGRLISTGTKTEWSERFMDFAEKAETGAIARALAVAGYGTEAALDLDEGLDQDRIADAPVTDSRPITISPSDVKGLRQGGRSERTTAAQLNEIKRLVRETEIGLSVVSVIENVCGVTVPDLGDSPGEALSAFIMSLTFEQSADLIQALNKARS